MRSAFRQVCLTFLWLLACANALSAQNPANNKPAASVQGRVLVEGAPQAGVIVMLTSAPEGAADIFTAAPAPTAVTDGAGRYRFAQVAAGKYRLKVHAPTYFVDASGEDRLTVSEAEMVENYDINLKRGGVIVGKVLDGDDQPRIEELVELSLLDEEGRAKTFQSTGRLNMTDDRGVFRIFGLTPGNYRVSAGRAEQMAGFFNGQAEYQRTFYPSTTEEAEAKLTEALV